MYTSSGRLGIFARKFPSAVSALETGSNRHPNPYRRIYQAGAKFNLTRIICLGGTSYYSLECHCLLDPAGLNRYKMGPIPHRPDRYMAFALHCASWINNVAYYATWKKNLAKNFHLLAVVVCGIDLCVVVKASPALQAGKGPVLNILSSTQQYSSQLLLQAAAGIGCLPVSWSAKIRRRQSHPDQPSNNLVGWGDHVWTGCLVGGFHRLGFKGSTRHPLPIRGTLENFDPGLYRFSPTHNHYSVGWELPFGDYSDSIKVKPRQPRSCLLPAQCQDYGLVYLQGQTQTVF